MDINYRMITKNVDIIVNMWHYVINIREKTIETFLK